jgi:predicted class III extradiol MEMO1 family dioxygenase
MDWKMYYRTELESAGARSGVEAWLRLASDVGVLASWDRRTTILSFPHTAMAYAVPLQARVVDAILRSGCSRVIALGVLHLGSFHEARVAIEASRPLAERQSAYQVLSGALYPAASTATTPFGSIPLSVPPCASGTSLRCDDSGKLEKEFSLDTFLSVLKLGGEMWRRRLPAVIPIYIGIARNPISGDFSVAQSLGEWLRSQWDENTAIVATGDVVHFGPFYGSEPTRASMDGLTERFRQILRLAFVAAFEDQNLEIAHRISFYDLKSDQREMLPVLAHTLRKGASGDILTFELSDYAEILDTEPPCRVASALIAYTGRRYE